MDKKLRCQSCGMPIGKSYFGTDAHGQPDTEYCKFCFQNGNFTQPNLTLDEMLKMSTDHMVKELSMSGEQATELANQYIPNLKRWNEPSLQHKYWSFRFLCRKFLRFAAGRSSSPGFNLEFSTKVQ